jgi:hypothetical protein
MKIIFAAIIAFSQEIHLEAGILWDHVVWQKSTKHFLLQQETSNEWAANTATCLLLVSYLTNSLVLKMEVICSSKSQWTSIKQHANATQKIALSIITAVGISNRDIPSLVFSYTIFSQSKGHTSLK